ncbi:hypothetical protein [Nannocystis sp. SCPEA4]|uniref:hypothetical protein n=1 Tax=Nannocystis sp. SCPEA4 TaxID=2996787 RepID=UPI00226E7CB5|nr:hypothetical protein [Nannocystis sp. SCPEA4]MCY1055440.1 hypothetical protein [Nannocystis sp. SCPEA4]
MATTNQHTAKVVVQGETDGVVKSLKNVTDETTKAKKATEDLDKAQGSLGSKLDAIEGRFAKMNGTIGKVTSILGGAGLVGAAMGAAEALGEMANRAQQIDGVQQALRLSIDKARASTMGMVSDFELASTANKALQLGVVKNSEEFAKLTATAAKLGMSLGQDVAQSVSDLTVGIGRQSMEVLDNLGILLRAEEAYDIYAQRVGKVASELTDAEKKQAFMTVALERAEEAANKANISLDTNAAAVIRVGAEWQNLKDDVVTGTADMIGAYAKWTEAQNAAAEAGKRAWELERAGATDYLKFSETELAGSLERLTDLAHQLGLVAFDKAAKPVLNAYKEEQAAYIAEQEMLAKQLIGPALPPGFGEKKKGKGKAQNLTASPFDRNAGAADFGAQMAAQLARDEDQREYNEAFATEIELREQNIVALEQEAQLLQQRVDMGLADADQVEELARRKYDAEQALLDFQMGAAATREEIFDLETQKRRRSSQEQLRIQAQSQQAETKSLMARQAAYERYGTAAADVLGSVLIASIDAANGEEFAAQKALAAIATQIRNQMILVSLKEFALAVASAASYNYPAAAQHAAAGGLAAAAAAAAGGAAAGINASIPEAPPAPSTGGVGGAGEGRGGSGGGGRGPSGDGDDDGVPTSYYDADLWQRRPDRMGRSGEAKSGQSVNITVNGSIIGGSKEELGTELRRLIQSSERAGRKVYA